MELIFQGRKSTVHYGIGVDILILITVAVTVTGGASDVYTCPEPEVSAGLRHRVEHENFLPWTNYLNSEAAECDGAPCINGGTCFGGTDWFTCNCPLDHTGTHCEYNMTSMCTGHVCDNGGSCYIDSYDRKPRCSYPYVPPEDGPKQDISSNLTVMEIAAGIQALNYFEDSELLKDMLQRCYLDNKTVPNIIHYVWLGGRQMRFHMFVAMVSSYKHINPCKILIHGDGSPPFGEYWDLLLTMIPRSRMLYVYRAPPTEIFGNQLHYIQHQADVIRMDALLEYGGIYLDTDVIVLKSFDDLRNHAFTLGRERDFKLCNGVIVAAKRTPFLKLWYESYHTFDGDDYSRFAYHSGELSLILARLFPRLIHIEENTMHRPNTKETHLLFNEIYDWSDNYIIHLWFRKYNIDHTLADIKQVNSTYGQVARYVLYGTHELLQEDMNIPLDFKSLLG